MTRFMPQKTRYLLPLCLLALLSCRPSDDGGPKVDNSQKEPASGPVKDHPVDEAMQVGRDLKSFPAADEDYYHDMDGGGQLSVDEVKGRNNWIVWTAGNDRFWDVISVN